jgi:branched-chain amino acid transport system substrate-binding protein
MEVARMRRIVFALGLLLALPPLAWADGGAKLVRIGALLPISGAGAYFGVQDREGIDLALDQLAKSPPGDVRFDVHVEDSACSPLPATQAARRLLDGYKPDVIIGEECSDATLAVMPLVLQAGVPLLNAGSSALRITDPGNRETFRILPDEVMQGEDLANHAYRDLGARTAVLLHENTNAGIGNAAIFARRFAALGGRVVQTIGFGRDVNDFTAIATRIAALGPIDVIPTYTLEGQGLKITQALAQAGVVRGGGGHAVQLGTIWLPIGFDQEAGKAADGYVRIVQFDPRDPRPVVQDFVAAFQAKFGHAPTHINAHAYDQIMLIADAVRRGGTTPAGIRDQLAATHGFSGVTGSVVFDAHNQNISPDTIHYIETEADGSWKPLDWK